MEVSSQRAPSEPQDVECHRSSPSKAGIPGAAEVEALVCLSRDEAQFIDAAFARILSGDDPAPGGAGYVDRKLREAAMYGSAREGARARRASTGSISPSTVEFYKAGIAAVQAHCVRVHGRRFQELPAMEQDAALALLEDGHGFGGIGQFQILSLMLVNDAVEAHLEATSSRARAIRGSDATMTSRLDRIHAGGHHISRFPEATDLETGDWPPTQPFSRRLGEALPGADYASAVEPPPAGGQALMMRAMLLIASLALLFVLVIALWFGR